MSERSEGILPEDETQVLGQIIDKIDTEKPNLGEAIRLCAIPHWFNKKILAWLRGESKPSERTETILDELKLKKLAFVGRRNLFLHDNVRNLLLQRWRNEKSEDFQALSGKVAAYYEYELQQPLSTAAQRAEWEREEMYHLLIADKERGIDCFKNLCNKAIYSYRLSTLDLLFSMAREQIDTQSTEIQLWIQFFEGKKNQVSTDWDKALEVWEELKEQRVFFTGDLEQTLAVHLSILYKDKGDWNKAIESLEDSLKILESKDDERGMITILNNRGYLYKDRADFPKAQNDFRRGLEIARNIGAKRAEAVSLKNLGLLYKDAKKWDEALQHFQSSLAILEKTGDEHAIARGYDDRALFYKDQGLRKNKDEKKDWKEAENNFKRALEILERIGDEHEKAGAFKNLGLFYKDRGLFYEDRTDLEKAEVYFQRAQEILERIGDQRRTVDILNCLGFLYTAEMEWHDRDTNFQRALNNFQEALRISKEMGDERGTAANLNNLGLLYQHKGKLEPAVDYFQQSLVIVKKAGDKMTAATTMYELASLYESMEDYDKAIELLNKVVRISERGGHPDLRIINSREKLEMVKAKATSGEADN